MDPLTKDTLYLGGVWAPPSSNRTLAQRVRTGAVAVNSGTLIDLRNPFGGFNQSGVGRELGVEGLEAYLETQAITPPGHVGT